MLRPLRYSETENQPTFAASSNDSKTINIHEYNLIEKEALFGLSFSRRYKMKSRLLISITLLSALAFILPANAKIKGLSTAGDPCEVLVCMAEKVQGAPQPGCIPVNQRFFNIRVYTPFYNPGATYVARQNFLYTCSGSPANQAILNMIMQRYGRSFSG